jgi:hypothetical protein
MKFFLSKIENSSIGKCFVQFISFRNFIDEDIYLISSNFLDEITDKLTVCNSFSLFQTHKLMSYINSVFEIHFLTLKIYNQKNEICQIKRLMFRTL